MTALVHSLCFSKFDAGYDIGYHGPRKRLFLNQMKVKVKYSKLECRKDIDLDELRKMQLQDLWLGIEPATDLWMSSIKK